VTRARFARQLVGALLRVCDVQHLFGQLKATFLERPAPP
jgi:hypothetical protein